MKLHPATEQYIKYLFLCPQQRSAVVVWKFLIIRWHLWLDGINVNAIPGFSECPPDAGKGYPRGMSLKSIRKLRPTSIEMKSIRMGKSSTAH